MLVVSTLGPLRLGPDPSVLVVSDPVRLQNGTWNGVPGRVRGREEIVIVHVSLKAIANLPQHVQTSRSLRGVPGLSNGRRQKRRQYGDDGYDDQEFDQCECPPASTTPLESGLFCLKIHPHIGDLAPKQPQVKRGTVPPRPVAHSANRQCLGRCGNVCPRRTFRLGYCTVVGANVIYLSNPNRDTVSLFERFSVLYEFKKHEY